jgi:homocysteine S-methyltransferase
MDQAGENGTRTGIQIAIELIEEMKPVIQGVYLMPAFNRYDAAAEIVEAIRDMQK